MIAADGFDVIVLLVIFGPGILLAVGIFAFVVWLFASIPARNAAWEQEKRRRQSLSLMSGSDLNYSAPAVVENSRILNCGWCGNMFSGTEPFCSVKCKSAYLAEYEDWYSRNLD